MNQPVNAPQRKSTLPALLEAMRPAQWTKNAVVLAAFVFAYWDREQSGLTIRQGLPVAIGAAVLFCLLSSAVYVMNDIFDRKSDRAHPLKKTRPIAAGAISVQSGSVFAVILAAVALAGGMTLSIPLAAAMAVYLGLQLLYSLVLKKIVLVDTLMIASGFVIRATAGAFALSVHISGWLLACTFLLALFLALCKRRSEIHALIPETPDTRTQRPVLAKYDRTLTDRLIAAVAAITICCYAVYTLWPGTVEKFGTRGLVFTVPFVIFGIFRYLLLVYRSTKGERPEKILLTDLPTIGNLILYAATLLFVLKTAA